MRSAMTPSRRRSPGSWPGRATDAIVPLLGLWSVYALANVYAGRSLEQLEAGLPFAALGALAVLVWLWRPGRAPSAEDTSAERTPPALGGSGPAVAPIASLGLAGLALVGWRLGLWPYTAAWAVAVLHLVVLALDRRSEEAGPPPDDAPQATPADWISLVAVAAGAVAATLWAVRPDSDDAYYLNAIVSALDHPGLPVLGFDGMHGDPSVPIQQLIHRPQTYELLVAIVARATGLSASSLYYVAMPALFALFSPVAQWLLLKRLAPSVAWLALPALFAILLAWGDGHGTFGNFAYVRLFQGKGVFVLLFVPLIAERAARFAASPDARRLVHLASTQLGAVVFTSSALVLGPVVAGFVLLASVGADRAGWRTLLVGGLASLPAVAVLGAVQWELLAAGPLLTSRGVVPFDAALGVGWRAPLALFAVLSLPILMPSGDPARRALVTRWVTWIFVLLLNGWTGTWLAETVARLFLWRIYWVAPLPVLAALSLTLALSRAWRPDGVPAAWRWTGAGAAAMGAIAFGVLGPSTLSPANGTFLRWAEPKVPAQEHALARRLVELASPGSTVLAPVTVATRITGFHRAPRLVMVRPQYTDNLSRHWGWPESLVRNRLGAYAMGTPVEPSFVPWALEQIDARCIDLVVTVAWVSQREALAAGLRERGLSSLKAPPYEIWVREGGPPEGCEPDVSDRDVSDRDGSVRDRAASAAP